MLNFLDIFSHNILVGSMLIERRIVENVIRKSYTQELSFIELNPF